MPRPSSIGQTAKATILRVIRHMPRNAPQEPNSESGARVYPFPVIVPQQEGRYPQTPIEVATRMAEFEAEIRGLKDMLADVKESRDQWRDQVVRLTATLPPPGSLPLWKRLMG